MPRYPHASPSATSVRGSVYSALAHRMAIHPGEVYPLHVGDTWMEPAETCRLEDVRVADHPGVHRYSQVPGLPALRDALADTVQASTGVATERADVHVMAGATGGLCAVVGALVEPGDEVLILAPFWPLIAGMVRAFHGVPVPVPFIGVAEGTESAVEVLEAARTDRTVAIYWNTPNNPTGRCLPREWLEAMAEWARRHDLWILADEVYEHYVYDGIHHYSRAIAPERTFSVHSFSKAYGMAGNRVGYVVGPREPLGAAARIATHTFYCAPHGPQISALRAVSGAAAGWVSRARQAYAEAGRRAAERLGVAAPAGSTFLFLDVADHLDDRGLAGFLEDCVDRGLFIAPGTSFGPYPTHVRLCFTSAAPDVVARGVDVLAGLLGR